MSEMTILKYLGAVFLLSVKIIKVQGLSCFSCYGIGHPRFCDHVSQCTGNEVCGIQKYSDPSGELFFNLGCVVPDICHSKRSGPNPTKICVECCNSDFCNIEGCGEHAPHGLNTSWCFNCKGLLPGEECHRVTNCDQNEVCYVKEETFFGETSLNRGCKDKHACSSALTHAQIFGKRSTRDLCQSCCDGMLCNVNCSSKQGQLESLSNPMSTEFRIGSSYPDTFIVMFLSSKQPTSCHYFDINNATRIDIPFQNNTAIQGDTRTPLIPNQIYVLQCDSPVSLYLFHVYHMYAISSFSFVLPNGNCSTIACIEASRRVIAATVDINGYQFQNVPLIQGINSSIDLSQHFIIPHFANGEIFVKVSRNRRICSINAFDKNLNLIPKLGGADTPEFSIIRYNVSQQAPFTLTSNCFISVQYLYFIPGAPATGGILVPGVDKYLSYYVFPTIDSMLLYIVIPSSFVSSLYVDDLPVNPTYTFNTTRFKTNFGRMNEYTAINVYVHPGRHVVESKQNIRFGLWVNLVDNGYGILGPVGYKT